MRSRDVSLPALGFLRSGQSNGHVRTDVNILVRLGSISDWGVLVQEARTVRCDSQPDLDFGFLRPISGAVYHLAESGLRLAILGRTKFQNRRKSTASVMVFIAPPRQRSRRPILSPRRAALLSPNVAMRVHPPRTWSVHPGKSGALSARQI